LAKNTGHFEAIGILLREEILKIFKQTAAFILFLDFTLIKASKITLQDVADSPKILIQNDLLGVEVKGMEFTHYILAFHFVHLDLAKDEDYFFNLTLAHIKIIEYLFDIHNFNVFVGIDWLINDVVRTQEDDSKGNGNSDGECLNRSTSSLKILLNDENIGSCEQAEEADHAHLGDIAGIELVAIPVEPNNHADAIDYDGKSIWT
jgi:hypothetical protein